MDNIVHPDKRGALLNLLTSQLFLYASLNVHEPTTSLGGLVVWLMSTLYHGSRFFLPGSKVTRALKYLDVLIDYSTGMWFTLQLTSRAPRMGLFYGMIASNLCMWYWLWARKHRSEAIWHGIIHAIMAGLLATYDCW